VQTNVRLPDLLERFLFVLLKSLLLGGEGDVMGRDVQWKVNEGERGRGMGNKNC